MTRAVERILVVKLCCLGDLIYLTPALRALRQAHPDATITLLISHWLEALMPCVPFVDDHIVFDGPYLPSRTQQIVATLGLVAQLRRRRFDLVLLGHRNLFFRLLARLSGAPLRAGFGPSSLLTHSAPFDPDAHEVDRYLGLVAALQCPHAGTRIELRPRPTDVDAAATELRRHGIDAAERLIGVFPGGGENPGTSMTIKRWPAAGYAALIRRMLERHAGRVLLLGGPTERALNEGIAREVGDARLIDLTAATPLQPFVALLQRCALVVSNDTGPLQMAAAVGTATVSIFGPSDPRLVAPRGEHHRVLWNRVACSPCYTPLTVMDKRNFQGCTFPCHTGTHACMRQLGVDQVFAAVCELLPA